MLSEKMIDIGKELRTFIKELESLHTPNEMENPLFDKVFTILDLIEASSGYKYSWTICHGFMSGYYTTIMMRDNTLGKPRYMIPTPVNDNPCHISHDYDATTEDISIGLQTKGVADLSPLAVWQVYLFCKMYRVFYSAEAYQGEAIFSSSDLDVSIFKVQHDDDREDIWSALREIVLTDDDIQPKVYRIGNNYCVECLWWFPSKGLVRETIEYWNSNNKTKQKTESQEVLIPYNYFESYLKHKEHEEK